jgi:MFS family permease
VRDGDRTAWTGRTGLIVLCALLLLGDLGWALRERAVQELFKVQLLRFSQDAIVLNVLLGALPALMALSVGPVIGAWSDRARTRHGRRIPFIFGTVVVTALAMGGMAFADGLATLAGCWIVFEMATIVGNPLFVALITDTVPHRLVGRFFGAFRIVSLATGAGFFFTWFGNDLLHVFRPLLLSITAIYIACMLVVCWRVREPDYPPPAQLSPPRARWHPVQPGDGRWAWLFGGVALGAVAVLPININAINASAQFGVDAAGFGGAIALTYTISLLLAWPLGSLADRYHPLRLGGVILVLYMVAMLLAWRLVDGRQSFLFALVVHGVLSGAFLSGTAALLPVLLPRERFSQLAAISASVTALFTMIATTALGALLDASGRDFHLLYLAGAGVAGAGVGVWCVLLRRFI